MKSTPNPSLIPLRHPTLLKLRGTRGYEGGASGGETRKSTPNPSFKKGGGLRRKVISQFPPFGKGGIKGGF